MLVTAGYALVYGHVGDQKGQRILSGGCDQRLSVHRIEMSRAQTDAGLAEM